ncbi:MAG: peptidyl-tRNA hydrolase, PTH1 family [Parcubacteria group bacterium Licking1014_17]|nr:MAG: peptidyl-tRNA hydrolase, PTH1 family [Parcubacteria group bacterium Licking1014_17]
MKILVGLGNPGSEYEGTKHSIGFDFVSGVVSKEGGTFSFNKKFNAEIASVSFSGKKMIIAKPFTFVNNSGLAVKKIKLFYRVKLGDIIVAHDDLDIPLGEFKISFGKNSGGHRGVQSIIDALKTNKFYRVRIGTAGRKLQAARNQKTLAKKKEAVGGFVLSGFSPAEKDEIKKVLKEAKSRLEEILANKNNK